MGVMIAWLLVYWLPTEWRVVSSTPSSAIRARSKVALLSLPSRHLPILIPCSVSTTRRQGRLTIYSTLARLMARRPPVDPRSGLTPPEGLVSTFTFITSSPSSLAPAIADPAVDQVESEDASLGKYGCGGDLDVKSWEGRVVFTDAVPIPSSSRQPPAQLVNSPSAEDRSLTRPVTPIPAVSTGSADEPLHNAQRHGSSSSPISVSSSSSPEQDLPRPRAIPRYTKLSSTAYTSPRLTGPEYRVDLPVPQASPSDIDGKPTHPFFRRDFQRSRSTPPPPSSQRPRMIATYSSTSQSTQGASQDTHDTFESVMSVASTSQQSESESESVWSIGRGGGGIQLVTHSIESRRYSTGRSHYGSDEEEAVEEVELRTTRSGPVDEVDALLADLDLNPIARSSSTSRKPRIPSPTGPPVPPPIRSKTLPVPGAIKSKPARAVPTPFPLPKSIPKPRSVALPSLLPLSRPPSIPVVRAPIYVEDTGAVLPLFRYQDLPKPPKVVYTRDLAEANDLLACLSGSVVAFDMEWPTRTWDKEMKKWVYGQAKTALMQFSDEKLVVLIHVWYMSGES